ncbi:MAG: hypothetical protein Kow009_05810 [Spirochaetales bacterium]
MGKHQTGKGFFPLKVGSHLGDVFFGIRLVVETVLGAEYLWLRTSLMLAGDRVKHEKIILKLSVSCKEGN